VKIHVILPINYEYDDEYYRTGNYGESYEGPVAAYRSRERAAINLNRLNASRSKDFAADDFEDGALPTFYKIVDLDVPDTDVETNS
jgi:hypothetical protein